MTIFVSTKRKTNVMESLTKNYTKGQKQALLESLTNQWENDIPMTVSERLLLTELTRESLNKRTINKLNNFASKLSKINERISEIESEDIIFKEERLELEKLNNNYQKLIEECVNHINDKNISQDEFMFSNMVNHFEGFTFEEVKNY